MHSWFKGEMSQRDGMPKLDPLNELDRVTKKRLKL